MVTIVRKNGRQWERGYELLWQFYRREGHILVAEGHIEADFNLGDWVVEQRHRHSTGKLPRIDAAKLASIKGWTWDRQTA